MANISLRLTLKKPIIEETIRKACEINRQKAIKEIRYFHNLAWKAIYKDIKKIYNKKERCEQYEIS